MAGEEKAGREDLTIRVEGELDEGEAREVLEDRRGLELRPSVGHRVLLAERAAPGESESEPSRQTGWRVTHIQL